MYELSRVRLRTVGPPGARFHDVTLDLSGAGRPVGAEQGALFESTAATSRPSPASLFLLENGGGKSVLLKLIFSVVLPGRRHTVGTTNTRVLDKFVMPKDVSHIVLEWMNPATGNLLLTGKVLAWRNQVASESADNLRERWYCLRPGDETHLGTLPMSVGTKSCTLDTYRDELQEAYAENQRLELYWTRHHGDWTKRLQLLGIDPELFRYQREMNVDEGEAASWLKLDSDVKFADFLLRAVVRSEEMDALETLVAEHVEHLAGRGIRLTEREFVIGALDLLGPIVELARAADQSRRLAEQSSLDVTEQAGRIQIRAEGERDAVGRLRTEFEQSEKELDGLGDAARQREEIVAELRRVLAELRYQKALRELTASEEGRSEAEALVGAWRATEAVHEHSESIAKVTSLTELIGAEEEKARPAKEERDTAARRLARALWATADEAAGAAEEERKLAREREQEQTAAQRAAREAHRDATRAEHEADGFDQQITRLRVDIEAAITEGLLHDGAALPRTVETVQHERDAAADSVTAREQEWAQLADQEAAAQDELRQAETAAADVRRRRDRLTSRLDEARTQTARLETNSRLAALLDVPDIDLERDVTALLDALTTARGDAERERTELKVADSVDEQARLALGAGDLLPPPQVVSDACKALVEADVIAVPGWRYLADISDAQRRLDIVDRLPHLASGILLNDPADIERARVILTALRPQPTVFVPVSTTGAFIDPDAQLAGGVQVVIPPHPALYDADAAAAEYEEIDARHAVRTDRMRELATRIEEDSGLTYALTDWRTRYPEGSIATLADELAKVVEEHTAAEEVVAGRKEALQRFPERRKQIQKELPLLRDARDTLTKRLQRLTELADRHAHLPEWTEHAQSAKERMQERQHAAGEAEEQATELQKLVSEHQRRADDHQRTIRALNDERAKLPGSENVLQSDPVPTLATALLRSAYEQAKETYRQVQVGSDLLEELGRAEVQAANAKKRYLALDKGVRDKATLLLRRPEASEEAARAAALDSAIRALRITEGARERAAVAAARCSDELERAASLVTFPVELSERPSDIETCTAAVDKAVAQQQACARKMTEHKGEHARLGQGLADAEASAEAFQFIVDGITADLPERDADTPAPPPYEGDAASARDLVARLTKERTARKERARTDELALRAATERLTHHATSEEFKDLHVRVQTQIRIAGWDTMAARAVEWSDALRPRLRALNEEIDQTERHRTLIVRNLKGKVDKALATLRQAQRVSRLPASLDDWAGQEFLRFRFTATQEDNAHRRIGEVIDEAAAGRTADGRTVRRDGMSLLLAGVRAAVPNGFRIDMLKPDAVLRTERIRVSEIKDVFSGGQQLTAAILLYCTMAALRASNRGRERDPHSGVLFLDNPIGRANADYLLALQRKVAEALGVQLIYTTGLSDDRTFRRFPLVLRLRNDADLRAGRKYLTVTERVQSALDALEEPDGTGNITTTRVFKRETEDGATGEAQAE
ncbi:MULTISPECIES: hypothetical protein [unclassified Streptomyces]|uniref:hypothetical protein n=1 Tax=unclassified Streptomyces TaxID=2593676 RepID=UPI00037F7F6B|nr:MULTISPECIES: hypothetical protein [unclassified Streptomyces]MYT32052.1 hypothetical protein [Streptomyces sp. SID8354]